MILKMPSFGENGNSSTRSNTLVEYCLAPLYGTSSQQQENRKIPVFAVYATSHYAIDFVLGKVLYPRRLPVVFDLDETLIKGRTAFHLSDESITRIITERNEALAKEKLTAEERAARKTQFQYELQMLRQDAISIKSYYENDTIKRSNGTRVQPDYTPCPFYLELPNGQLCPLSSLTRPIIQPQPDLVFTRVRPDDRQTSMIFRIRPYWPEVRTLLTGGLDKINGNEPSSSSSATATGKPLIEAFVCTTAKTEYAHEVWRVLDRNEALIHHSRWPKRITTKAAPNHTHKYLAPTLSLPDHYFAGNGNSVMPFAVILDDTIEVWEPKVRKQVIHVSKWEPYQEYGRTMAAKEQWEKAEAGLEMLKLGGVLRDLQKEIFDQIDTQKAALLQRGSAIPTIRIDPTQVDASYAKSFVPPPWTCRVLPEVLESAEPLPLPSRALTAMRAREEKQKEKEEREKAALEAAAAAVPAPQDPRIAARAAAAAAAAKQKELEEQQKLKEPEEFNPDTDKDVFANWNTMVAKNDEEEASNKRKRHTTPVDEDMEPSRSPSASLDNAIASEVLGGDSDVDAIDLVSEEEEQEEEEAPLAKRSRYSKEDPIILLSQEAQAHGKYLTTETTSVASGGYLVQIKSDGGKRLAYATGATVEEARRTAAVNALNELQGRFSFGAGGASRAAAAPVAAAPSAPFGQIPVEDEPESGMFVAYNDALDKLREVFPTTGQGQKVIFANQSEPGDLVIKYSLVIRRDYDSDEPELTAVGVGDNYYFAKREAARTILTKLGYQVV
jgi:hypothetical protein